MKIDEGFLARMRVATRLLRTEGPMAATLAIQRALRGSVREDTPAQADWTPLSPPQMRDINPPPAREEQAEPAEWSDAGAAKQRSGPGRRTSSDMHPDKLARFREFCRGVWKGASLDQPIEDVEVDLDTEADAGVSESSPGRGRFISGSCSNRAGTRAYKLYVPSGYGGEALPLIVMLHGCTQDPDDFAAGTAMNAAAEERNCFVVYPAQAQSANGSKCWNWFKTGDQRRDRGEPSIIADITREITRAYKIDSGRVYVAGLSAGGAMAVVMGATYPDLYAAVGVHSGLPYAVAHDVPSAFAAMKNRKSKAPNHRVVAGAKAPAALGHAIPVIVFHGDCDTTVHPQNGDYALAQCANAAPPARSAGVTRERDDEAKVEVEKGAVPAGHAYTRMIHRDARGEVVAEQWIVHGAGHAWAGGSSDGSYTDPKGPNATREMLRFFYDHGRTAA